MLNLTIFNQYNYSSIANKTELNRNIVFVLKAKGIFGFKYSEWLVDVGLEQTISIVTSTLHLEISVDKTEMHS